MSNLKVGIGITCDGATGNINAGVGIVTAKGGLVVGSAATIYSNGNISCGIITATSYSGLSAGKILQVVEATTTTEVSSTSTSMADTGLSASITPSASGSKVLVFVNQSFRQYRDRGSTNNMGFGANLLRGSTVIVESKRNDGNSNNDFYFSNTSVNNIVIRHTLQCLDSPSTTSSTTYKTQFACATADDSGQVWAQPSWESQNRAPTSSIILLEVGT